MMWFVFATFHLYRMRLCTHVLYIPCTCRWFFVVQIISYSLILCIKFSLYEAYGETLFTLVLFVNFIVIFFSACDKNINLTKKNWLNGIAYIYNYTYIHLYSYSHRVLHMKNTATYMYMYMHLQSDWWRILHVNNTK